MSRFVATMSLLSCAALVPRSVPRSLRRALRLYSAPHRLEPLRLRDAASREVVTVDAEFEGGPLRWYACGPTVYDATHLGHARTYVTLDLVRRAAIAWGGSRIDFAMGVTDVDDKIIARSKELGVGPLELARAEEAKFFEDLDRLGCARPDRVLRVSEHMDEIVAYVGDVLDRGFGYVSEGGDVWFDVGKLGASYGAFAEGRGTSGAAAMQSALEAEDKQSVSTLKPASWFNLACLITVRVSTFNNINDAASIS